MLRYLQARTCSILGGDFNLLLVGQPASSKTQFLTEIMKAREGKTVYYDATNTTNRILQVLEEEKPEIVVLDELDKLPRGAHHHTLVAILTNL